MILGRLFRRLVFPVALAFIFAFAGLVIVAFAGLGSVGTQILVGGYCATHYPQSLSATALSWSLGIGRIGAICGPLIGGLIAGMAFGWQLNFYMFAAFAVVGAIVVFSVPKLTEK